MHLPYFIAVHGNYTAIKECWEHYQWLPWLQRNPNELLLLCTSGLLSIKTHFLNLALADSERISKARVLTQ